MSDEQEKPVRVLSFWPDIPPEQYCLRLTTSGGPGNESDDGDAVRACARCRRVLVDEDDAGWYYQVPVTYPEAPGLTFMDRVHECDGLPHEVISRALLGEEASYGQ